MEFELKDIHIESSTVCSANCFMCPHDELNRNGSMDFGLFKKIADDAIALGCKRITPFRLGDPLLFEGLFLWLDYLKDENIIVSLFTNASNLTTNIGKRLLEYDNLLLTISFHGVDRALYETNTGLNYDDVRDNIIRFMSQNKDRRIPTTIYCLSANPESEYERFRNLWSGFPFNEIGMTGYMEWAGKRKVGETKTDQIRKTPEKYQRVPCSYVLHHIDVMYDGKVCLCCVGYQGEVIFGDLKYQSIVDIYNGRLYQYYLRKHISGDWADLPLCSECSISIEEKA